jgi:DNA (cytosine-5)-methyltransferase 1
VKKASLFSGIGGIDLAAHWAGMETVVFCEREPFPQRVLRKHWPHVPIIDDVREVTREELEKRGVLGNGRTIDIISAGYPCQPFSYAGKRRGAEDNRHLWPEVKRILEEIRPRWFVGENVAGHVTLGLDDVLADLGGAGYTAQAFLIPAAAVRASHRRDRVFIVAHTNGERCTKFFTPTISEGLGQHSGGNHAGRAHGARRATQSRMGRGVDELPTEMDGRGMNPLDALKDFIDSYPQPALMGQPQYEWEPPRVATGVKNRAARLKALGNAVDPLQIFPIMYAIKIIDDWVMSQ